jgi:hypothetical protein
MKIITAAERLAEQRGVSLLIVGQTGIGKTCLLKTLDATALGSTLFIDVESGDLPVAGLPVDSVRPRTWQELMNLAALIGGPDPSLPNSSAYSRAHFDAIVANPDFIRLADYRTFFVDSLTAASRLSFIHSEQSPDATTDRGKRDLRSVYGIHARHVIALLTQLQRAPSRPTVIFVAILERATDDLNTPVWQPQMEGSKAARELPGIVDQVITMASINFGDGRAPTRAFVCTSPNSWGYPAKDRSGRLEQLEEPHLGKLLAKLTPPKTTETIGG